LRTAKAKNWEKDKTEKDKPESETHALAETLCQIDAKNDPDDEVYEWDEQQDDPPGGSAHDLKCCRSE
jgi:hypothetical protein